MSALANPWLNAVFGALIGIGIHAWWSWRDLPTSYRVAWLFMLPIMIAASVVGKKIAVVAMATMIVWYAWIVLSDRDSNSSLMVIAIVFGVGGFFWGEDFLSSAQHLIPGGKKLL
jgi:hypothetical protein